MRWNPELNTLILQAISDDKERESLQQVLEENNLETIRLAEVLDSHPACESFFRQLANIDHPDTNSLLCGLFADAAANAFTVADFFAEGSMKYLLQRHSELLHPYLQHPSSSVQMRFCQLFEYKQNLSPEDIAALAALFNDRNLAMTAIHVFTIVKVPEAAPALLEYLRNDGEHWFMAAIALWKTDKIDICLSALRDNNRQVRVAIANAMGLIYYPPAIPVLLDALTDTEWLVRKKALNCLAHLGDKHMLEDLMRLRHDPHHEVRIALIAALVEIAELDALPELFSFIHDKDNRVRRAILQNITKLNHPRALPIVEAMLNDSDADVQTYTRVLIQRWR